MVKIILEKDDLLKIIQQQYSGAELVTDLTEEFSITISIPNFQPVAVDQVVHEPTAPVQAPEQRKQPTGKIDLNGGVRTESTLTPAQQAVNEKPVNIDDSVPNALALKNTEETNPGGAMGGRRGNLPKW